MRLMRSFFMVGVLLMMTTGPGALGESNTETEAAAEPELLASLAELTVETMLASVNASHADTYRGTLVAVVTGDTVIVDRDGAAMTMRLYGVDCPQPGQAYHEDAKNFVIEHFLNADVDVTTLTVDSQQNPVVLIFNIGGNSISHFLVAHGMAWWDRQNAPDDALLRRLNAEAITETRGLYADLTALAPWDYRNSKDLPQFSYTVDEEETEPSPPASDQDEEEETPRSISARGTMTESRPRAATPATPPRPSITKEDVGDDVDLPGLVMRHQPRIAHDDTGRPLGLTATNIGAIPYARQLGFREGDIVSRVNGIAIESEAQIMSLIPQFENVRQFEVEVIRNGQPVTIPISVP